MMRVTARSKRIGLPAAAAVAFAAVLSPASADAGPNEVQRINLVSDQPGQAMITDPHLVNAWGMSHGPNTPIWVSDNGGDVSTLYTGAVGAVPVSQTPLVVAIPDGAPTGQVFNDTTGFLVPGTSLVSRFIFASEHGSIDAWSNALVPNTAAVHAASVDGATYKGLALVHASAGPMLLAANFTGGSIDVFDSSFTHVQSAGMFEDSSLPSGYAPFNVAVIGDRVFVTYALREAGGVDDVSGPSHGIIDTYSVDGQFLSRFATHGALNSPWGLAVAPSTFGRFAGDLLVGNFGDGRIHAFNLTTGENEGVVRDQSHKPIVIDGLWGLIVGDASSGGTDTVWFSAGPGDEEHGLLGILRAG